MADEVRRIAESIAEEVRGVFGDESLGKRVAALEREIAHTRRMATEALDTAHHNRAQLDALQADFPTPADRIRSLAERIEHVADHVEKLDGQVGRLDSDHTSQISAHERRLAAIERLPDHRGPAEAPAQAAGEQPVAVERLFGYECALDLTVVLTDADGRVLVLNVPVKWTGDGRTVPLLEPDLRVVQTALDDARARGGFGP
jgi:hypothetical protein